MTEHLLLARQHIQDHDDPTITLKKYWGYPSRVLPCKNDAGSCAYLDAVYNGHNTSMLYTFILWGVMIGLAVACLLVRGWRMEGASGYSSGFFESLWQRLTYAKRRWLSSDVKSKPMRWLFGRTSRLQVTILAVLLAYLLIFSLVGGTYKTWVTPIKNSTLHNTRTGLGPWADRVGALAYALTPFTVLLAMRESVLSLITGIPYQHFNFLHRWTGRIIFVQAVLHTLGWTIVEGKLYQPQPKVYRVFISQQYMIFGVIAMFIITLMLVLSTKTAIRWFGYEVFRIGHWILAILYLGACWGHWDKLWCWMVASLALVMIDQFVRSARVVYLHYGGAKGKGLGFSCSQAQITILGSAAENDLVVRLDYDHEHRSPWEAGQHFQLTFPSLSIWESHPFTPSSLPGPNAGTQHHTYLLRVRKGITARLAALGDGATVPVVMAGPYGRAYPSYRAQNILAVAGGTGATFTLPIMLQALRQQLANSPHFAFDFVAVVKRGRDLLWVREELMTLRECSERCKNLRIKIFVTRENGKASSSSPGNASEKMLEHATSSSSLDSEADELLGSTGIYNVSFLGGRHPSIAEVVGDFVERAGIVGGSLEIVGSGPEGMGSDMRSAVALLPASIDVSCYWDSRGD
ncbi:hypothetical protein LTR56_006281 [Elasticomyces elasticus]|nr:hypothetical protein LTR56_006281 [Elasticomyces elasticus]KAK3666510.1 hypothetical protein LTR22_002454 [Elasticomyces elasticus]KAK4928357.1 hypothetical protein LTR49_005034 [Elasticomyces elasticus]KAK5753614.1 hypothetical protein LTS12_016251 [Elasticomyces elasticus]